MFDPVQAPSLRHAFELVNAAILEADSRLRQQILDRARDQDFAGTCFRGDARADVKRETEHLSPAHIVFTRVQPHPAAVPRERARLGLAEPDRDDLLRAADRPRLDRDDR